MDVNDPRKLIATLLDEYYTRHKAFMDGWYIKTLKKSVTNFTEQNEIIIHPAVYDEIITAFMLVMKISEDQRNDTINSLHEKGIFYMDSKNYIIFKRISV